LDIADGRIYVVARAVSYLEGEEMDALEHPLRRSDRRRPLYVLMHALIAIAMLAAFFWIFYGRFGWLSIILIEAAVAYVLVATLGRMTPPPGATPPAHSFEK
jgi:uncharacterized membrane protein YjjP (DUF1212 family)